MLRCENWNSKLARVCNNKAIAAGRSPSGASTVRLCTKCYNKMRFYPTMRNWLWSMI